MGVFIGGRDNRIDGGRVLVTKHKTVIAKIKDLKIAFTLGYHTQEKKKKNQNEENESF